MNGDASRGWESIAADFARLRSGIGAQAVQQWAACLPPGANIVDIGCGTGVPIARALADMGFTVYGIDPSPTLLAAFRRNLPGAPAACEPAETSGFFNRRFDAAVMIGVIFLLPETDQAALIGRIGQVLAPGGHFLFSAPHQACSWMDSLTGRQSFSPGAVRYQNWLAAAGLSLHGSFIDAGANNYFHARSTAQPAGAPKWLDSEGQ